MLCPQACINTCELHALQYQPPGGDVYRDPESLEETPLVPGMTPTENSLRWGFINKVFGIVGCQLALTAVGQRNMDFPSCSLPAEERP